MTEAVNTVRKFIDAVNDGDVVTILGLLFSDVVIVDDIYPFRWHGLADAEEWLKIIMGTRERLHATLDTRAPDKLNQGSDRAYAVITAALNMTSSSQGELRATGTVTLTLVKMDDEWLFDTIVWSAISRQ
jgi:ketosteroid isomerase-like protein